MNGKAIQPLSTAKLLGVTFDQELQWKEHVQQAIKRATKVSIALGGLQYLWPEQMRQFYQTCVTPIVDYASTVWHNPLRDKTHLRHLNTVQRTSLIRILCIQNSVYHKPRSGSTHPSNTPASPSPSPKHHRKTPHPSSRPSDMEYTITSSEA